MSVRVVHKHHPSDSRPPETIPTTGQDQEKKSVTHTRRNKGEPWRVQATRQPPKTRMAVAKGSRTGGAPTPLRGVCPKRSGE
jgi:hypothetical protein